MLGHVAFINVSKWHKKYLGHLETKLSSECSNKLSLKCSNEWLLGYSNELSL